MFLQDLNSIFQRDLKRLSQEISAYPNEEQLWIVKQQVNNSAGSLALHLVGNLNHFIGHALAGTDYVRDREFEFSGKVSREQLLKQIDSAAIMLEQSIAKITAEDLSKDFPIQVLKEPITTGRFLLHLTGHLNYHLGQISYHRRLLTEAV